MLVFIISMVYILNNAISMSYSWLNIWFLSSIIEKAVFSLCALSVFSFCTSVGVLLYMEVQSAYTNALRLQQTTEHVMEIRWGNTMKSVFVFPLPLRKPKVNRMHGKRRHKTETSSFKLSLCCWGFSLSSPRIINSRSAYCMINVLCSHTATQMTHSQREGGRTTERHRKWENELTLVLWT